MTYLEKLRLDGRRALVTGGAGGIGAACVDALLEDGAEVVVVDFSPDNLESAKAGWRERVSSLKSSTSVPKTGSALASSVGAIDVLLNNDCAKVLGPALS